MKRALFGIAAVLLSTTLALSAAELFLRLQIEGTWASAWATLFGGSAPYSELGTGNWIIADPKLGYRLNPAMEGINSLGVRNPEIPRAKPAGQMRIVVIGDSVAWPKDGFVDQLRGELSGKAEVINAAIPGYTTYQERMLFEAHLYALRPDLLILQYCLNDHHRFLHRFDPEVNFLFTQEARRVLLPQEGDPLAWMPRWSYLAYHLRMVTFRRRQPRDWFRWKRRPDLAPAWREESWVEFREHLEALRDDMTEIGGKVAVVMVPFRLQYRQELLDRDRDYVLKPQALMAAACRDLSIPLIDLYHDFGQADHDQLYVDGLHFSEKGHSVAKDVVFDGLTRFELIPAG